MSGVALGYAVRVGGVLDVRSVAQHARAAMVNFLHMNVAPIPDSYPDESIRELFVQVQAANAERGVELVEVELAVVTVMNPATVRLLAVPPQTE